MIVKDLDKSIEFLTFLGMGPFTGIIMEVVERPPDYDPEKGVRYE